MGYNYGFNHGSDDRKRTLNGQAIPSTLTVFNNNWEWYWAWLNKTPEYTAGYNEGSAFAEEIGNNYFSWDTLEKPYTQSGYAYKRAFEVGFKAVRQKQIVANGEIWY